MKTKAGSQRASSDRRVLLSIVAYGGSLILGLLAFGGLSVVFAQPHRPKLGANFTRADHSRAGFSVTGQNFWAQTNGPQGGDGIALATNSIGHACAVKRKRAHAIKCREIAEQVHRQEIGILSWAPAGVPHGHLRIVA